MARIIIAAPLRPGIHTGNRVTASRWRRILEELGHDVRVLTRYEDEGGDLLVALHARRQAPAVFRFRERNPASPIVVALTGTDLYGDLRRANDTAHHVLELATCLVVLQPLGLRELPPTLRRKARVIHQSTPPNRNGSKSHRTFDVCVVGHLRPVKDPFRAAMAARRLPGASRIRILQVGHAMDARMAERAQVEARRNARYRWLGAKTPAEARGILGRSRLLVLSSRMEGGANVVSEAVRASTPILASRIPGSIGLLGEGYPGFFEVGDTAGLAALLWRAESDARFYAGLHSRCSRLASLFEPARELAGWRALVGELGLDGGRSR